MYAALEKDINYNPNSNYNTIHNIIDKAKKLHLHTKTVKFNKHKHKKSEWITSGIIISIKFRDNMYRKLKETPSDTAEHSRIKTNLHTYNNILKGNIRLTKKIYYHACFAKTKFDLKNVWRVIKKALNKTENKNNFPDHFKFDGKE